MKPEMSRDVFVVHGHDAARHAVARFLGQLGLTPIVLDELPNRGLTILEKLEAYSNAAFAVILLTPDDVGSKKGARKVEPRARQNVILEWGYFLAKLGRQNVSALYVPGVELPSDLNGLLYVELDPNGGWREKLLHELREARVPLSPSASLYEGRPT